MTRWFLDNWPAITAWLGTTGVAIWAWFSAHNGQLRKVFRWLRSHFYLRTKLAAAEQSALTAADRAISAETRAEQFKLRAEQAEAEIQRLQPPKRLTDIPEAILLLLTNGYKTSDALIAHQVGISTDRASALLHDLLDAQLVQFAIKAGTYPFPEEEKEWSLTVAGQRYLTCYELIQ